MNETTSDPQYYHWLIDREMLRLLIQRRGFTPRSLAVRAGMDKRIIYRMLSGERKGTTYPTALVMAEALEIDIELFADPRIHWQQATLKSG